MTEDVKHRVQQQFGAAASDYVTSDIHAQGESLAALLELTAPQPTWQVLDVATGAGHTALLFAPKVAHVVALDLTEAMLTETQNLARRRGITNLETARGDAEAIPFATGKFDLVTCRLAFHHFPNPEIATAELVRVLKPGGLLGFTDNITVEEPAAADYYNAYEKLRDPSHYWVGSQQSLIHRFTKAGLEVTHSRKFTKEFEFQSWADRQHVAVNDKQTLLDMMQRLPEELQPLFQPRWADGTMYFQLWETVIVARKPA